MKPGAFWVHDIFYLDSSNWSYSTSSFFGDHVHDFRGVVCSREDVKLKIHGEDVMKCIECIQYLCNIYLHIKDHSSIIFSQRYLQTIKWMWAISVISPAIKTFDEVPGPVGSLTPTKTNGPVRKKDATCPRQKEGIYLVTRCLFGNAYIVCYQTSQFWLARCSCLVFT